MNGKMDLKLSIKSQKEFEFGEVIIIKTYNLKESCTRSSTLLVLPTYVNFLKLPITFPS